MSTQRPPPTFTLAVLVLFLVTLWALGTAAGALAQDQATLSGTDLPPLTTAQQEARELAILFIGEMQAPLPATKAPLVAIVEHITRLGNRAIVPLFSTPIVAGRLLGGMQTLLSPVGDFPALEADAYRPAFVPASQALLAMELTVQ